MALKQATKEALKALGIDADALSAAITNAAEVDFAVPPGQIFTDDALTQRDANVTATAKAEGMREARGVLVTELGKKIPGLTLTGQRIGDLASEVATFMNAGKDTQVKALQDQVTALLTDKETLTAEVAKEKGRADAVSFDSELMGLFPQNRTQDLTDAERLTLLKGKYTFERTDTGIVVKEGGKIVENTTTRAPLAASEVVGGYFTTRNWVAKDAGGGDGGKGGKGGGGGRGGTGSDPTPTSGLKTLSQARASWKEANPDGNLTSPEAIKFINEAAAADKTFDWNS